MRSLGERGSNSPSAAGAFGRLRCGGKTASSGSLVLPSPASSPRSRPQSRWDGRLARPYWGHGYATEGARAALAFGFDELDLEEIVSFTSAINERSRKVTERLGMWRDPRRRLCIPSSHLALSGRTFSTAFAGRKGAGNVLEGAVGASQGEKSCDGPLRRAPPPPASRLRATVPRHTCSRPRKNPARMDATDERRIPH